MQTEAELLVTRIPYRTYNIQEHKTTYRNIQRHTGTYNNIQEQEHTMTYRTIQRHTGTRTHNDIKELL